MGSCRRPGFASYPPFAARTVQAGHDGGGFGESVSGRRNADSQCTLEAIPGARHFQETAVAGFTEYQRTPSLSVSDSG